MDWIIGAAAVAWVVGNLVIFWKLLRQAHREIPQQQRTTTNIKKENKHMSEFNCPYWNCPLSEVTDPQQSQCISRGMCCELCMDEAEEEENG